MKKQIRKITGSLLAAGLIAAGLATGITAYAAGEDKGSAAVQTGTAYTLEEMLKYAIEDEFLAQAEYDAMIKEFGSQRPFFNIIRAEDNHIEMLEPLLEEYGVAIPSEDWAGMVQLPATENDAYAAGVEAEQKNIAMYEQFLSQELPDDVRVAFENLKKASENHLKAFQKQTDGTGCTLGNGTGCTYGNGNGNQNRGSGNSGSCTSAGNSGSCTGTGMGTGNRSGMRTR